MNKHLHPNKSRGFTLIELLIVISIIGILAAVLIAVINPAKQQDKARDASLVASIGKIGLAINSFNAAYNRLPTCLELIGELNGAAAVYQCSAASPATGTFSLTGVTLPAVCLANGAAGSTGGIGAVACNFTWNNSGVGCLSAKNWGVNGANGFYRWTSTSSTTALGALCTP